MESEAMNTSAVAVDYTRSPTSAWITPPLFVSEAGDLEPACRAASYLPIKRAIDIPLGVLLFILVSPLMLIIALAVRLSSPGPVLFRQPRLGRHGRRFPCLKFRSMRVDAELALRRTPGAYARYVANGYKLPDGEDPRITRIGRFLRRTSLDELPQLFNVMRGEMSLVGPRPIVPDEVRVYGPHAAEFLSALPGITGRWQVSGRSKVGYPERAGIELDYVYQWSLLEDLRILVRTVPAVLRREGAH
jgi:lipopolysaccharide/colanic/teichoic acid biosynthesis glycosyltransferase